MREHSRDIPFEDGLFGRNSLPRRNRSDTIPDEGSTFQHLKSSFQQWKQQLNAQSIRTDGIVFLCDSTGMLVEKYDDVDLYYDTRLQSYFADKRFWTNSVEELNAVSSAYDSHQPQSISSKLHSSPLLHSYDSFAVPITMDHDELIGVIGLIVPTPSTDAISFTLLRTLSLSYRSFLLLELEKKKTCKLNDILEQVEKEAKRRDILFQAAKKLHSIIDVDSVLCEVLETVRLIFPDVRFELYLSQDHHNTTLPMKPLAIRNGQHDLCTQAFMGGGLVVETSADGDDNGKIHTIAAPLCGKQGVYGVLNIVKEAKAFDETDMGFITMLVDTAGTAFENATLYEQSNMMVRELRLINEITKRLNQSLKLNDIFQYATSELINIFNADFCLVLERDASNEQLIVQASNLPLMSNDNFAMDYGFSGIVFSTKEPIIISDYWKHSSVRPYRTGDLQRFSSRRGKTDGCHRQFNRPVCPTLFGRAGQFHAKKRFRRVADRHRH